MGLLIMGFQKEERKESTKSQKRVRERLEPFTKLHLRKHPVVWDLKKRKKREPLMRQIEEMLTILTL